MIDISMIIGGILLLFLGGELLIRGAVSLAVKLKLSTILVGAVIIGFGTSMPEMTVSLSAALKNVPDITVGNVVGSNIANILLIIGISAILSPIHIDKSLVLHDTILMIIATLSLIAISLLKEIGFITGFIMFSSLIAYIIFSYIRDKNTVKNNKPDIAACGSLKSSIYCSIGLGLLIIGAYILVEGASSMARDFGISELVIGLTIVAVGTSLPELATAIVAGYRKHNDIIIGNILGSNIFNILFILGTTAMIIPIPIDEQVASIDIWIMCFVTIWLALYLLTGKIIGRASGAIMLVVYLFYILWLYNANLG